MREKGSRFFWEKINGVIFFEIREQKYNFDAINTTIEQDIESFPILSERNRDTFDVLELPFGAFAQDFAECNGYRVNVETKTLEFSYPDPNAPQEPPVFQRPLTEQIKEQKQYTQQLNDDLMSLSDYVTTL